MPRTLDLTSATVSTSSSTVNSVVLKTSYITAGELLTVIDYSPAPSLLAFENPAPWVFGTISPYSMDFDPIFTECVGKTLADRPFCKYAHENKPISGTGHLT